MSAALGDAPLAVATRAVTRSNHAASDATTPAGRPGRRFLVRAVSVLAVLLIWQVASAHKLTILVSFKNIPTPVIVGRQFLDELSTRAFYLHIAVSLRRIALSFALATTLGVAAGVLMGRSRLAHDLFVPHLEALRPIPAVAWIPLAILMFPSEESSIVYITFLGSFFPIVLNTIHGVQQTPETLVRVARSLGAGRWATLRHVVLPSALPSILAGLAIGMGVAWFSLLAGEIISGQYGIGYYTWNSYTLVQYPQIIVGMLTIGGLGALSTWLVRKASRPLLRWEEARD